jgi:hypothetical protein
MADHQYVWGTLIPQHFLAPLGYVNVRQTQLDNQVNHVIAELLGVDHSSAIAVLAPVMNLTTRLDMMKNLIPLKIPGLRDRCKMETLRREATDLSKERNRLTHDLPYSYSPTEDSISFVRTETWTSPQIRAVQPKRVTPDTLIELAEKIGNVQVWMGFRFFRDFDGQPDPHPAWLDDDAFPWRDRYEQLLQKYRQT